MLMKSACDQIGERGSYSFQTAQQAADAFVDSHIEWQDGYAKIGARTFFQEHVERLLRNNKGLKLEKTEKSGEYKLTLKDMWRLDDLGVNDKFLKSYTGFNHTVKMLSTYLNRGYVKSDLRVHPRFVNILRTGRTSCSAPNIQNLPSRDKVFPIKNVYTAYTGTILCATDFSFVELVNLAESCIQRFGYSVMGDIINAGVDPHRWFAGVRAGLIDGNTDFTKDPTEVERVNAFLLEHVTKEERQHAKAANFGLPGGMSAKKFLVTCREQGIVLTLEEATELRNTWINTFSEMKFHFSPTPVAEERTVRRQYGSECPRLHAPVVDCDDNLLGSDDPEDDDADRPASKVRVGGDVQLYKAKLVNGMVRNNCSYCAALNVQFQGLAAYGVKLAMWNLAKYGLLPRLVNMIHDEVLYCLYPEELDVHIPEIERQMIEGMQVATPHVKVGVETSCMTHWDKGAKEFAKLEKDEKGRYIIEAPAFVRSVYDGTAELGV